MLAALRNDSRLNALAFKAAEKLNKFVQAVFDLLRDIRHLLPVNFGPASLGSVGDLVSLMPGANAIFGASTVQTGN